MRIKTTLIVYLTQEELVYNIYMGFYLSLCWALFHIRLLPFMPT